LEGVRFGSKNGMVWTREIFVVRRRGRRWVVHGRIRRRQLLIPFFGRLDRLWQCRVLVNIEHPILDENRYQQCFWFAFLARLKCAVDKADERNDLVD
jgi:hypothetical protein